MGNARFGRPLAALMLAAAGLTLLLSFPVGAQKKIFAKSDLFEGDVALGKVSSRLLQIRRLTRQKMSVRRIRERFPLLRWRNDQPEIEVRFRTLTPEIVAQVQALGMQVTDVHYKYARLYGVCDLELLGTIAALPEVTTIHPNYEPYMWVGAVTGQGDNSIRANLARTTLGVNGSGVKVGVLSDSFNDTLGGNVSGAGCARTLTGLNSQGSGDLPTNVTLLDNGPGSGTDEGAAMAELIYDLAPGANILFHSAFNNEADFAQGITNLRACGADVIVDNVIYFREPMFQDGIIAQAAQAAVNAGVPYFSSAGNGATFGVDQNYVDSNPGTDDEDAPPTGDDFHNFGGGDRFAAITVPPDGCGVEVVLQWNEPFSGTLGPGASTDLDLYLCTEEDPSACGDPILTSSGSQGCAFGPGQRGGDPVEEVGVTNPLSTPQTIYVAVEHHCGNKNVRFRVVTLPLEGCDFASGYTFESGIFNKAQIYGHAAAAGVMAVAAVDYVEIDSNGTSISPSNQINVEPFSSAGGNLPFYFDGSGNPLSGAPVVRFKPEIAAPDGTNTTFFGGSDPEKDTFPNFFGTSASAPHAAGVAALMLEANPALTPAGVRRLLTATARDIEASGVDRRSGYGLIDALNAARAADNGGVSTAGLYQPSSSTFYLRNTNTTGVADITVRFGSAGAGWTPIVGDWDGDGDTTVGLYDPVASKFYLRNSNTTGVADITVRFGSAGAGWTPIVGDWNGDGQTTVGLRNPTTSTFYLRNTNTAGIADVTFRFGSAGAGWIPRAGNWVM